jgi:hypothetical protein
VVVEASWASRIVWSTLIRSVVPANDRMSKLWARLSQNAAPAGMTRTVACGLEPGHVGGLVGLAAGQQVPLQVDVVLA